MNKAHSLRSVPSDGTNGSDTLDWSEIGVLCEGLAFAPLSLRAATRGVTREYDLGPRGAWILNLISSGKRYPLELSAMLRTGRSLITSELVRLTKAGLVIASPGQRDRRRSELSLTPLGIKACQSVREEMARIVQRNLAHYSAEEIRLFSRMLHDARQLAKDEATHNN